MFPVGMRGGIYCGIFTPTEAAAVAVVTTIVIGLFQGTLTLDDFPKMLLRSAKVNGVILPIIAFSLPLAQALASLEVPQTFVGAITDLTEDPTVILLLMLGIFIAARSEEHTSELQSLMRISYAVFCLKKKNLITITTSAKLEPARLLT